MALVSTGPLYTLRFPGRPDQKPYKGPWLQISQRSQEGTGHIMIAIDRSMNREQLLAAVEGLHEQIRQYRGHVRQFYYALLLETNRCPGCGGRMQLVRFDHWRCACGLTLDPTEAYVKSPCCGQAVTRQSVHYACAACKHRVDTRFHFDECVFDRAYFRERMRASRERRRRRRREWRRLLRRDRSAPVELDAAPDLEAVPDLDEALNAFLTVPERPIAPVVPGANFDLNAYRRHIHHAAAGQEVLFRAIPPLGAPTRQDVARRFVALLFMEHDRELRMVQYGKELVVEWNEAYNEGQGIPGTIA